MRSLVGFILAAAFFWELRGAARSFSIVKEEGVKGRVSLISLSFFLSVFEGFNGRLNSHRWMIAVGFAVLGASILLFSSARTSIRGKYFSYIYSDDAPQFLHTSGPYRYIRNPFYASYLLMFLATALMVPNAITVAIVAVMMLFLSNAARHEEQKFSRSPEHIATEYANYKKRTGRFIPKILLPPGEGAAS